MGVGETTGDDVAEAAGVDDTNFPIPPKSHAEAPCEGPTSAKYKFIAHDSCSTLLHALYLPPALMSVQYCGKVPQSQFLLLATPVASTCVGSSDAVRHFRLAYMPWQSTTALVAGVAATVDDDVAGVAATVDGVGATADDDAAARVVDDVAAFEGAGVADDVVGAGVAGALEVADAEGLTSAPLLLHVHALGL